MCLCNLRLYFFIVSAGLHNYSIYVEGFLLVFSFRLCFPGARALDDYFRRFLRRLCNVTHVGNKFAFSSVKHAIKSQWEERLCINIFAF